MHRAYLIANDFYILIFVAKFSEFLKMSEILPWVQIKPRDLSSRFHQKSQSAIGGKQYGVFAAAAVSRNPSVII